MAEPISDEKVAAVLRVFVRACAPMLARMRDGDEPCDVDTDEDRGLLDKIKGKWEKVRAPGTEAWARLGPDERTDWWVNRVGRLTSLAASVTGLAGALGDRLPLQDMLGSAGQGLLLCAIASERGVDDVGTRVRLLAAVLFERDIPVEVAAGKGDAAADERRVAELTSDVPEGQAPQRGRRFGVKTAAKWLWRQGRMLLAISDELEKRPQGRFYHQALGMLPVVGMAGDYLGERSALKRAARAAEKWLRTHVPASS